MATGDAADFASRIAAVLPGGWFPIGAPVLNGILNGFGSAWASVYQQIQYTITQSRIATATGAWLDGVGVDYFGGSVSRLNGEQDTAYRARIQANLLAPKNTRQAIIAAAERITGYTPAVFEPAFSGDTGGYGVACGYGIAGGYGSLALPFQFFITAYRPHTGGIPGVDGYGGSVGGYGVGAIEYANESMLMGVAGDVTDEAIYAAIFDTIPAGTIVWMRITNTAANPIQTEPIELFSPVTGSVWASPVTGDLMYRSP